MAIAKPSPLVSNVSGPIGGTEFFQYGSQVRIAPRRSTCTATTERAYAARAAQTNASREWRNLTDAQRAGFTAYAQRQTFPDRFGSARNLTGFQVFLRWYPWCQITYPTHPTPYYDPPVTDKLSQAPGKVSLKLNTTPYAEITVTSGLFFFFLSWWHIDVYGPHNKPGLNPKMWRFVANVRMFDYTQDVTSSFTTAGVPFLQGATYSIRLRIYFWRNWPSDYARAEAICTAP